MRLAALPTGLLDGSIPPPAAADAANESTAPGLETPVSREVREYAEWAALLSALGVKPHTVILRTGMDRAHLTSHVATLGGVPRLVVQANIPAEEVPYGLEALLDDAGTKMRVEGGTTESAALIRALRNIPAGAAQQTPNFSAALSLADRLLLEAGIPVRAPERQLMRYTLGWAMFNALSPQAVAFLNAEPKASTRAEIFNSGLLSLRGRIKVERILNAPYTLSESLSRLDHFEALFRELVQQLQMRAEGAPYTLYLSGGAARGRYSPFSDLDLYIDTPDSRVRYAAIRKEGVELSDEDRRALQIAPAKFPRGAVSLGDGTGVLEEQGYFRRLFQRQAKLHGLLLDLQADTARILPEAAERAEREPPSNLDHRLLKAGPLRWSLRIRHWGVLRGPEGDWLTLERLERWGRPVLLAARQAGYSADELRGALRHPGSEPCSEWTEALHPLERIALDYVL